MRTLVVTEFVSLDGVVEAPGGEPTHPQTGWTVPHGTPELYEYKLRETMEAESLLLGRVTYEGFAAAWPEREGAFADKMNAMPKDVATTTLTELAWNARPLSGDVAGAVAELKKGDGGPILFAGSATLRLLVYPVAIGGGKRIFPDDRAKIDLRLDDLVRYDSGVLLQVYRAV